MESMVAGDARGGHELKFVPLDSRVSFMPEHHTHAHTIFLSGERR